MSFFSQYSFFIVACIGIGVVAVALIYWLLNESILSPWFKASEDIVPSFMSVPAFLFGLTVSTFTANVMDNHATAKTSLINETAAIRSLIRSSETLSGENKSNLILATNNYAKSIIDIEWPSMARGDLEDLNDSPELDRLTVIINKILNSEKKIGLNETRIESSIQSLHRERLVRLSLASDIGKFTRWPSIYVLSFMMLLTIGILQLRRSKAMKISLTMGALCIGSSMIFIFLNISPYRGPMSVSPSILEKSINH